MNAPSTASRHLGLSWWKDFTGDGFTNRKIARSGRCLRRLERIGQHGGMRTSVVLSTRYEGRPVQPQPDEFLHATHSEGWRSPQRP
jgi:hypothetical protein